MRRETQTPIANWTIMYSAIPMSGVTLVGRSRCCRRGVWLAKQMQWRLPDHFRGADGSEKAWPQESERKKVKSQWEQVRGERHAPSQARHVAQRQGWKGRQGEEPQAGDRNRLVRSARQGEKGAAQEQQHKKART